VSDNQKPAKGAEADSSNYAAKKRKAIFLCSKTLNGGRVTSISKKAYN
jgi:hypothetical protein